MTTEVLRNMIYAGAVDADLGAVVLDEVHYLEDPYRGPVWEEVILHLPSTVVLVCLSATVSNHAELGRLAQPGPRPDRGGGRDPEARSADQPVRRGTPALRRGGDPAHPG